MNSADLVLACRRSFGIAKIDSVLSEAIRTLESNDAWVVGSGISPVSAEERRETYRRRLKLCQSRGNVPVGLPEAAEVFETIPDGTLLRLVTAESDDGDLLGFWVRDDGMVVACVIGKWNTHDHIP